MPEQPRPSHKLNKKMKMNDYEFILKFSLPDNDADPEAYVASLEAAGCNDALIGLGKRGRIALEFMRSASSAKEAMVSALADVRKAIPGASLIEAQPDLVGLSDIADFIGCSRQNVRKTSMADSQFPIAVHEGSLELFHMVDVLNWLKDARGRPVDSVLLEVAMTTRKVNLARELSRLPAEQLDPEIQQACVA